MRNLAGRIALAGGLVWTMACAFAASAEVAPGVTLPLDRRAYIVGEKVPLALVGAEGEVKVEAVDPAGARLLVYQGKAQPLVLDTAGLAPGRYALQIDGEDAGGGHHPRQPDPQVGRGNHRREPAQPAAAPAGGQPRPGQARRRVGGLA